MTGWSPVDGCVLVGLVAAAVVGDELVAPLAGALGGCFVVERLRGGRKLGLPARPRMTWRRARDAALVCVTVGIGVVGILPVFYGGLGGHGRRTAAAVVALHHRASCWVYGLHAAMRATPRRLDSAAAPLIEFLYGGVGTGMYFAWPPGLEGDDSAATSIEMPSVAVDRDGAPHPFRGPVFSLTDADGSSHYQFAFVVRRPPGPPIAGRYEATLRVYRNYFDDDDPEKRESEIETVTILVTMAQVSVSPPTSSR